MTAKEKAHKIFNCYLVPTSKHYEPLPPLYDFEVAQECALILVDEVLNQLQTLPLNSLMAKKKVNFWMQVRMELEMITFAESRNELN